jgi:hypothetical protein
MSAEWKPGDVAEIRVPKSSAPGYRVTERGYTSLRAVFNASGGWSALENPDYFWGKGYAFHDDYPRPLVVIDPENREQVERLESLYLADKHDDCDDVTDCMQAALREFANPTPPRIEEPGTWGVVEAACVHDDHTRRRWVRYEDGNWYAGDMKDTPDDWGSLIAPTLVREGVTP